MQMWQIVANLEFVTGFAIDLQTRKPNISPRVMRYNITTRYIDFYGLVHSELVRNGHYGILRHVKMTLHELVCDNLVYFVV